MKSKRTLIYLLVLSTFSWRVSGVVQLTTLFSFYGTNGLNPEAGLVQAADGCLYGTTRATSAPTPNYGFDRYGAGTLFKLTTNGVLSTLVRFSPTNRVAPRGGVILGADGDIYGLTEMRRPEGKGTIYRLTTNGVFSTFASFAWPAESVPEAGLMQGPDGSFYGISGMGGLKKALPFGDDLSSGLFDNGYLFRVRRDGTFEVLLYFDGTNGANPYFCKPILDADGRLYGATECDGLDDSTRNNLKGHGFGSIFRLTPNGAVEALVIFNGSNGLGPNSLVQESGGLFGTTEYGGSTYYVTNDRYYGPMIVQGDGTLFKIATDGSFKTLLSFRGSNGSSPEGMILAKDGNFYGFTRGGGAFGHGTLFQLKPNGVLTTVHSFTDKGDDQNISSLIQGNDGTFYGTSDVGGKYKCGRIFRLTINSE